MGLGDAPPDFGNGGQPAFGHPTYRVVDLQWRVHNAMLPAERLGRFFMHLKRLWKILRNAQLLGARTFYLGS